MTWILQILMCGALLAPINRTNTAGMLVVVAEAVQRNSPPTSSFLHNPFHVTDLTGAMPDSVRLKMFAMLLRGELAAAGEYYLLATGASQLPTWFTALRHAFDVASRAPNACQGAARAIAEGFRRLGQSPQLIRISSTGGDMLSWKGRELVSDNNFHVAVLNEGRIFDAFTGAAGMTWAEYQVAMAYLGTLQYTVRP
jgi:hypothetical protein